MLKYHNVTNTLRNWIQNSITYSAEFYKSPVPSPYSYSLHITLLLLAASLFYHLVITLLLHMWYSDRYIVDFRTVMFQKIFFWRPRIGWSKPPTLIFCKTPPLLSFFLKWGLKAVLSSPHVLIMNKDIYEMTVLQCSDFFLYFFGTLNYLYTQQ